MLTEPLCALQHNMWVTSAKMAALSIITGGGKWVEMAIAADPLYQHLLLTAEKKFWRCVQFGDVPRLVGVEPPRPRIEAVRSVDMAASHAWAEVAALFRSTRPAFLEHERAKTELKGLMPEDAREAFGHGVRGKRSKAGAVSFEAIEQGGASNAPVELIDCLPGGGARQGADGAHQSGEVPHRHLACHPMSLVERSV